MAVNVSPTTGNDSTHHLSLTDADGTVVGLNCYDRNGDAAPTPATSPFPGYAAQLRQGRGKHADRVPPFEDISMSDFSGGMAMLHYDEDNSRYLDGKRCDTSDAGEVRHAGLETYTTGLRDFNESWPGNVSWLTMYKTGTESKSIAVTANASYNANSVVLILKKVGAPTGSITVTLADSDDGNAVSKSLTVGTDCLTDLISERVEFEFASVKALTDTTAYKLTVAYADASSSASAYVDVGVDGSDALYYRVLDDTGAFRFKTVEYKNALYGVTIPDDGAVSKLYILGDRGAADANTGALTTLVDATKTWTVNEWAGDIVAIANGDGKLEEQPYRTIVSNTADTLTVTPAFTVTHSTSTEYVIVSDSWKLKQTLTARAHDIKTVSKFVYITFGYAGGAEIGGGSDTDLYIRRYREYNASGTWTEEITSEDDNYYGAEKILGIMSDDTSKHETIIADFFMASETPYGTSVSKFQIPYTWEDMIAVQGTLCENDRAWTDTIYANSVPNPYYYGSIVNVGAGFTTGKCAHWKLDSPLDVRDSEAILIHLNINPAGLAAGNYNAAGDIKIILADGDGNEDEYNLDGTIEEWYDELIFLLDPGTANADMSQISDIYWHIENDEGQVIINVWGSILLTGGRGLPYRRWHSLENGEIVNNMIEYGGGAGEVTKKPWILTDRAWRYIENDTIKEIYLGEIAELKHPRSGEGACVNDVNLYANAGETIQSYYSGSLRSVGPDVDYGLPENRRGIPCSMASYPGKVLSCIDAGSTGYSSVIYRRNHGWHESYRALYGKRIKEIVAVAQSASSDRLYISEGADVLWIPISINPETEDGYEYCWESVLETSRVYGGLRETEKYYHAVTLVTENLSTTHRYMQVDYRTSENSSWTTIGTNFTSSPRQRQALVSTNNTKGRWIQFRVRSYTDDRTETPKLVSIVLDSIEVNPVNDLYTYTVGLKEGYKTDVQGGQEDLTGSAALTQLETWRDSPVPLTLASTSAFEHGKLVKLEGLSKNSLYHDISTPGEEFRLIQIQLIEVV